MAFRLYSNDLQDGGKLPQAQVFNGMGYHGDNLSPHLAWDGVPAGTKSFVIAVYDPDAPTGSGWWHWVVANIPADVRELPQGAGSGKRRCPPAHCRPAPTSAQPATAARRRQRAKATATSSPCMRWMWNISRWMRDPAARWWASTSISTASAAPR